jgi:hypothetical protein
MGFMILCSLAATSLALAIGAWCRTTTMSLAVLPMVSRRAGARAGHVSLLLTCYCGGIRLVWCTACVHIGFPGSQDPLAAAAELQALEVSRLFGGFLLSPANLPDYFAVRRRPMPCCSAG